jgi:cytoskeletal protein CcmA (bactofilin family)
MKKDQDTLLDKEFTSIFNESMKIVGDVESDSMIVLEGKIHGNVKTSEKIESYVDSEIVGNIYAKSALIAGRVVGNLVCEEQISVDQRTKIVGDLSADEVTIAGIVIGNVFAKGVIKLKQNARIKGDLTSTLISIEEGAMIDGNFKTLVQEAEFKRIFDID